MPLTETGVPLLAFALTTLVAWLAAIGLIAMTGAKLALTDDRPSRKAKTSAATAD
jgi:hypothetical protein